MILTVNGVFARLLMVTSDGQWSLAFRCLSEVKCYFDVLLLVANGCASLVGELLYEILVLICLVKHPLFSGKFGVTFVQSVKKNARVRFLNFVTFT